MIHRHKVYHPNMLRRAAEFSGFVARMLERAGPQVELCVFRDPWGGGPVLFDIVHREGLLAQLTSDEVVGVLADIPDEVGGVPMMRRDDGEVYWVGAAISSFGFTINIQYLEEENLPEPSMWTDLANETYAVTLPTPSVGTADATKSTSNTRMFEIILQAQGWQGGWKLLTLSFLSIF